MMFSLPSPLTSPRTDDAACVPDVDWDGAAALVGPAAATAEGGMGGTYLRTVGQTGTAALTVSAPQCAPVTVQFTVTKKECAVWN